MDIYKHNSLAWDNEVKCGNPWTKPVSVKEIELARKGKLHILLTPVKHVPANWITPVKDRKVLCLASGGGQQGPLLAAAGAKVTVLDASKEQLETDRIAAKREQLDIITVLGDMADLSCFLKESFDIIVNPVSNCFIPDVKPVWRECFRVLRNGGRLLSGFNNPILYCFDRALEAKGVLQLKHNLPYSDINSLTSEEKKRFIKNKEPFEFGHSLQDQLGGQITAGFSLRGFYEDKWGNGCPADKYFPQFIATLAVKERCSRFKPAASL